MASGLVKVADYEPGDTFGPRTLGDYEFVWLLAGSATWSVGEGVNEQRRSEVLVPGSLALARAGTVDSYQWDERLPSRHAYVHFGVTGTGDLPPAEHWPAVRRLDDHPLLGAVCGRLLELSGDAAATAQPRTDQLVGLLLDAFVGVRHAPTVPDRLRPMTQLVRDLWARHGLCLVDVDELATAANLSAGHVFRLFRAEYGCGPARALELVRLSRAATSLQRSNATLDAVARQSGFANPYHFSRRFSAVYGVPPGAYRALQPAPDPQAPVRDRGLLPLSHALLQVGG